MSSLWMNSLGQIIFQDGVAQLCDTCPCPNGGGGGSIPYLCAEGCCGEGIVSCNIPYNLLATITAVPTTGAGGFPCPSGSLAGVNVGDTFPLTYRLSPPTGFYCNFSYPAAWYSGFVLPNPVQGGYNGNFCMLIPPEASNCGQVSNDGTLTGKCLAGYGTYADGTSGTTFTLMSCSPLLIVANLGPIGGDPATSILSLNITAP